MSISQADLDARVRGRDAVDRKLYELGMSRGVTIGRVDWRPDPELETPEKAADSYFMTVASDSKQAQHTFSAEELANPHIDEDNALHEAMEQIVAGLVPHMT
ncbi:MAG: hypothetical protein ACQERG_06195 [Pseudomonadota bacterium]